MNELDWSCLSGSLLAKIHVSCLRNKKQKIELLYQWASFKSRMSKFVPRWKTNFLRFDTYRDTLIVLERSRSAAASNSETAKDITVQTVSTNQTNNNQTSVTTNNLRSASSPMLPSCDESSKQLTINTDSNSSKAILGSGSVPSKEYEKTKHYRCLFSFNHVVTTSVLHQLYAT